VEKKDTKAYAATAVEFFEAQIAVKTGK